MTHRPTFTGFVLSDGRRGGICWDEKPRCVAPHRLVPKQKEPILTEAITTCVHRDHREAPACGVRLYVAQLTFGGSAVVRGTGERSWLVVEITQDHMERMRREPMIFLERMVILGVALPGVEIDVMGTGNVLEHPCRVCGRSRARHGAADHDYEPRED